MDLKDLDGYIFIALGVLGVAWLAWASRRGNNRRQAPVDDQSKK